MTHLHELPPNPPNMFPDPTDVAKQEKRERLITLLVGNFDERPYHLASWLWEGCRTLRRQGPPADCDDHDAYWMMVEEMEHLHRTLDKLSKLEHGESVPPVRQLPVATRIDDDIPW